MDVITHALAGAATGAVMGHPFIGVAAAVVPDIVLGVRRRREPTIAYDLTHSLPFAFFIAILVHLSWWDIGISTTVFVAIVSHIVLDAFSHGVEWAPPLFYPYSAHRFSVFEEEWEWFNASWCRGAVVAIFWSLICHLLTLS